MRPPAVVMVGMLLDYDTPRSNRVHRTDRQHRVQARYQPSHGGQLHLSRSVEKRQGEEINLLCHIPVDPT